MANDFNNRQGQMQGTADKASEFVKSTSQQFENKGKEMAGDAQKMLKEGQEQAGKVIQNMEKQIKDNPWPIVAGVAIGAFLLGTMVSGKSK